MDPDSVAAAVARARRYPFARAAGSYLFTAAGPEPFDPAGPEAGPLLDGRTPVLAYGSNSSPQALRRKFGALPGRRIPVTACRVEGFDAVYSRHFYDGYIPATLAAAPGTTLRAHLTWLDREELAVMDRSEHLGLNYELRPLAGTARLGSGRAESPLAYHGLHGELTVEGSPIAVAGTEAEGRRLAELDQDGVLELARRAIAPDLTLEEMVAAAIRSPRAAAELTAALKRWSRGTGGGLGAGPAG